MPDRLASPARWRPLVLVAGASIWVVAVLVRLLREDRDLWFARDDAVITLSHARNAADFGSIGISPIGDRTEGFSSPLHFGVAYALELFADWGFGALTVVIMVVAVAVTGALVTDVLLIRWTPDGPGPVDVRVGLASSAVLAVIVASSWTTTGWIGSGMENPIVIACGFAVIASVARATTSTVALIGVAAALAAFGLSRVELAAFSLPLAVAVTVVLLDHPSASRRRKRLVLAAGGAAVAAVVGVHVVRRVYFGAWLPNTAVAQQRVEGAAQVEALVWLSLLVALAIARPWIQRRTGLRPERLDRFVVVGGIAVTARLLWLAATAPLPGSFVRLAAFAPLLMLCALLAGAYLVSPREQRRWHPVDLLSLSVAAAPIAQYVVAGPARMHEFRVLSVAIPFIGVVVVGQLGDRLRRPRSTPAETRRAVAAIVVPLLAALGVVAWHDGPTYLNWDIDHADTVLDVAADFADAELTDGAIPILANPDLGKVSFDKSVIVVDLGLLGDPALAELADRAPETVIDYLRVVAAPDVVELHGDFTCSFGRLVFDRPEYRLAGGGEPVDGQRCEAGGAFSFWYRAEGAAELMLTNELMTSADPASLVRDAVEVCRGEGDGVFRCEPVRRALQRAAIELRSAGTYDAAIAELSVSPSWALSEPLLRRDAGWGARAADAYLRLAAR